jgi:deferrochelatase/peroxidase EfeB
LAASLAASGAAFGSGLGAAAVEKSERTADADAVEPFWGEHQGGITTPIQSHSYFVALDLKTTKRDQLIKILRAWTMAAAHLAAGQTAAPVGRDLAIPGPDTGEALGLPAAASSTALAASPRASSSASAFSTTDSGDHHGGVV